MKVVVDRGIKSFAKIITSINGFNEIEFLYLETKEITNDKLKDIEALFIRSTTPVDKALLKNTKIKIVGSATAGIDHLDTEYLNEEDIKWFCAEGSNSLSVVNYVMSAICYLKSKNLFKIDDSVGIIGYGNIGKKLKAALDTFSITNLVYDPFLDHDFLSNINTIKESEIILLEGYLWDEGEPKKAFNKAINNANKVAMSLSDQFCVDRHKPHFLELVKNKLDITFANEQEITSLIGAKDFNEVINFSKQLKKLVVITRGEKGAVAIQGEEVIEIGIHQNLKILDLTGAGDLFAAGFLHGYINKLSIKESLDKGTEMSSKVIQQIGARL